MVLTIINSLWYQRNPVRWILYPFALIYQAVSMLRRGYLQCFRQQRFSVPVIVVGNLTVGGVGKTPFVIALALQLRAKGLRVGIVSRGYGATIPCFPHEIKENDNAAHVGDEPLLLARKTACPVVIAPKRVDAVRYLLDIHQSQIIISDDGLQHYAMGRAIEIVVIDSMRGLGNGLCLPAGPLREGTGRLQQVDFILANGGEWTGAYRMDLVPGPLTKLSNNKQVEVTELKGTIAAVAGIGNPQRFFATLNQLGIVFKPYPFADHHCFQADELNIAADSIVMTEKDAVKCQVFATEKMYFLPVDAQVNSGFWDALWAHKQLQGLVNEFKSMA